MRISDLVPSAPAHLANVEANRVTQNSRETIAGALFFAIEGASVDGHDFVGSVIERGASAAVIRKDHPKAAEWSANPRFASKVIAVEDARQALAEAACAIHGHPSKRILVCGVTGTNGKTTSTYLIESLLDEWAMRPAVIGTVENRCGEFKIPATHTTPDAANLQALLQQFLKHGAKSAVMEVSSHALDQRRTGGMRFEAALFTNLTQDHLDYHKTMDAYFEAKTRLFLNYPVKVRAIHSDDPWGEKLVSLCMQKGLEVITFGKQGCNVNYEGLKLSASGIEGTMRISIKGSAQTLHIRSPLIGKFNAQNIAGAVAVGIGLGIPLAKIASALTRAKQVPGRMESIPNTRKVTVLVDYAHTPDALENVLKTLKPLAANRLICVFGCGGDRDPGKRPSMGEIAESLSDEIYITSDNPRTEDPAKIIDDILKGLKCPEKARVIPDRRQAITQAAASLQPQDILLIAGKGHEDYQIIGTEKTHFDDREEARKALA